ncbi:zinc finger C2H2 type family protein [Prunus dulcis]|uniref:Zinc finger C2H2 type family protein n=1 Tax=Prunus dulcis TaxID=3755 RepID=A0A4Y1QXY0_PRUDU|nr:zinc finger C2H2 type family protein [Prunus dulcis]
MLKHLKFHHIFCTVQSKRSETLNPFTLLIRYCHFQSEPGFNSSSPTSCLPPQKIPEIAIFRDLDTKPPKSVSPYEAAVKLKTAALSFRLVRHIIAYSNRHALYYVPQVVRERKERNRVVIRDGELNVCRVCGRRFYTNEKLLNHFKIYEKEHMKRLSQVESARGSRRVKLVGKYSMKMEKYKNAARDVLTPKAGRDLADEVKRAGFWVRSVVDKPQRVDAALRNHIVDMMDYRRAECLIWISCRMIWISCML